MLKDLIATEGEAAAARITKQFRFTGDAERELYDAIKQAVDKAHERGTLIGMCCGERNTLARIGRG